MTRRRRRQRADDRRQVSRIEIIDGDPKTFHAKLRGELFCGEKLDQVIQYTGEVQRKP